MSNETWNSAHFKCHGPTETIPSAVNGVLHYPKMTNCREKKNPLPTLYSIVTFSLLFPVTLLLVCFIACNGGHCVINKLRNNYKK